MQMVLSHRRRKNDGILSSERIRKLNKRELQIFDGNNRNTHDYKGIYFPTRNIISEIQVS
jgi:hypothetical protein